MPVQRHINPGEDDMAAKSMFTKAQRDEIGAAFGGKLGKGAAKAAAADAGAEADKPFCLAWPVTRAGLVEAEKLAKRPLVKFFFRQAIEAGDIAFANRCPQ